MCLMKIMISQSKLNSGKSKFHLTIYQTDFLDLEINSLNEYREWGVRERQTCHIHPFFVCDSQQSRLTRCTASYFSGRTDQCRYGFLVPISARSVMERLSATHNLNSLY